jgi:hypothetical protein
MGSAVEKGHARSEVRSKKSGCIRLSAPEIATPLRWIIGLEFDFKTEWMLEMRWHSVNQPVFKSSLASEMRRHAKLNESSLSQTGLHTITVTEPGRTNAATRHNSTLGPAPRLARELAKHGTLGRLSVTQRTMNVCDRFPPVDVRRSKRVEYLQ